jgi:hypothetical protein
VPTYFVKDILAHLRLRAFCDMKCFSVNVLRDIGACFIAFVHMHYLVFLRRLKHGGP